jgi:hypothetical protein
VNPKNRDKSVGQRLRGFLPTFLGGITDEPAKEEEEKKEIKLEEKKDEPSGRFGRLMDGVLSLLSKKKKVVKNCYMGQAGKDIKWDPIKKRYVFPGADLTEEEKVAPPPKMMGASKPKEAA